MSLSGAEISDFNTKGHVTVNDVLSLQKVEALLADIDRWSAEVLAGMKESDREWYLDRSVGQGDGAEKGAVLRKLDDPVFFRPAFRALASDPKLVAMVESVIGPGLSVAFSQVFMKPGRGGGPKPLHQDNFYFGPTHLDGMLSAWVALDDADEGNGCLLFAEGSHREPVHQHAAPEDEPFNLQLSDEIVARYPLTAAPVGRGGVSFHHGNVYHSSSQNTSDRPRREVALHYVNGETRFDTPAWSFDSAHVVPISQG